MAFLLIDSVVGIQPLDEQMIEWFEYYGIPYTLVLTKIDKATQKDIAKTLNQAKRFVGEGAVILSSAKENRGKKELLSRIFA